MQIEKVNGNFTICKLKNTADTDINGEFLFTARTDEEISIVCLSEYTPKTAVIKEEGFMAFRIKGVLDFSLIGILSEISRILAENKIGIFAISTFNTDYLLVKAENYKRALKSLEKVGYEII
ncbi:MAG: ACT domain-containing protein [Clostridiales bacterium]|nr:ACT domain-containing protein [Clostridiales bacterium]